MSNKRNQHERIVADPLPKRLGENLGGTRLFGWKCHYDTMAGSLYWEHEQCPLTVYATPYWEGSTDLEVQIVTDDGKIEDERSAKVPGPVGVLSTAEYIRVMVGILSDITDDFVNVKV